MIPLDSILVPLSAVLGLSLIVERVLEITKNILERLIGSKEGRKIPTLKKTDELLNDLEEKYEKEDELLSAEKKASADLNKRKKQVAELKQETDPVKRKVLKEKLTELEMKGELDESVSNSKILVKPATDPDSGETLRVLILQLLGFAIGIFCAHYTGVQLFSTMLKYADMAIPFAPWVDYLFTGLLIGGGSGPMHVLVRFVTQRKFLPEQKSNNVEEEDTSPEEKNEGIQNIITPSVSLTESDWIDIPYKGGVDCEALENVHRRKKNPNLIVYHHTAMNSKSTFQDVVNVIKDRGWSTGYHCVVQYNGAIHPFCRWDRYGNHAAGNNMRSLGISFNGNYETNPKIPFSNPEGKMGPSRPSEEQLKAGARVVTLWSFIYKIGIDFDKTIIPHNQISTKTCPGSSFPYDEFKKWIEFFHDKWDKSDVVQERIEAFKLKPYLYIKGKEA